MPVLHLEYPKLTSQTSYLNSFLVYLFIHSFFLTFITFTLSVKFLGTTQIRAKWTLEFLYSLVDQHMPHKFVLAIERPRTVLDK